MANRWQMCEELSSLSGLRYFIFRHEKIGTVVELDGSSLGDFRCCSNDFEPPFIVTKYGTKRPTDNFCLSDIVANLRINQASGHKMDQPKKSFGNWTAEVIDATIVIKNIFAVCCRLQAQESDASTLPLNKKFHHFDLDRSLQIFLTEDSVVWVGLSTSINIPPISFRISNGVPESISMSQDKVKKFLADILQKVGNVAGKKPYYEETSREIEDDSIGVIRRGMMSRTSFQNIEEASAAAYLKFPARTRIAAVNFVELSHLSNCRTQGLISQEDFQMQSGAILNSSAYSSPCLKARQAMDRSMYIDPESKEHFPDHVFPQWNQLTWLEKHSAAKRIEDCRSLITTLPFLTRANDQNSSFDSELPMDKRYSKHFQEMMRGEISGGIGIARNDSRCQQFLLLRNSRVGKEIDQSFEECEICGRPCVIPGSGMCDRCKAFELEKDVLDIKEDTLKPDTYLGDSRALLRHPGFDHYVPVPLSYDQTMRLKISRELSSCGVEERRSQLTELSQALPHWQPMQSHRRTSTHSLRNPVKSESLLAQCSSSNLMQLPGSENPVSADDVVSDLKKLHPMIKSNRFDEVQALLLRASGMQNSAWTDEAVHEIIDRRDRFGNTPLITAVQQGHKRLCKLLISLGANTNSQNKEGNTPLHYASMYGYHGLFDYLSKRGADDTVTNYSGKLCYQMSESKAKNLFGKSLKYEGRKEEAQFKFPVLINRAMP